jgi:hypothetical protein
MNIKKQKLLLPLLLMIVFAFPFIPFSVKAVTSFGMYPEKINVKEGQNFILTVKVNPNGQKNYTVKASIKFPADSVSIKTWQYANDWIPLRKGGYDSFSNTDGTIIRAAGYPNGFDGLVTFGTATFVAKKSGTIEFSGENLALDENNKNQYNVSNKVDLTVVAADIQSETTPIEQQPTEISQQAPEQLFDIILSVSNALLNKSSDLVARTQFTSFGTVPTLVNLVYRIEDASGKEIYKESGEVIVETEQLVTKEFKNLDIGSGKYTLVLSTTYGDNIQDEFRQAFGVKGKAELSFNQSYLLFFLFLALIILIIFIIFIFRSKNNKKSGANK